MPVIDHLVSFRNGSQVMVRGLQLADQLGYCQGARVQVADPQGSPSREPWIFIVPNNEHATLTCKDPPPPEWIQPGVLIRVEVDPPIRTGSATASATMQTLPVATVAVNTGMSTEAPFDGLAKRVIYAVDVGSPGAGLAWARLAPHTRDGVHGSMDFGHFLDLLVQDLRGGQPIALGFEAPIFVPVADNFRDLTRARTREPTAWSFGAGAYVTTIAIPLMAYTLRHVRTQLKHIPPVTLDPAEWLVCGTAGSQLFLWEAFVTGAAHAREPNEAGLEVHLIDAATAVLAFAQWEMAEPRPASHVTALNAISTVGAAILWSNLGNDPGLLHQQTLVLRPTQVLGTAIRAYRP